jgi:hypothetical protein
VRNVLSLTDINVFKTCKLLERVYFLNEKQSEYVSISHDEHLATQVKTVLTSQGIVPNQVLWCVLISLNDGVSKTAVHKLGGCLSRAVLSKYGSSLTKVFAVTSYFLSQQTDFLLQDDPKQGRISVSACKYLCATI